MWLHTRHGFYSAVLKGGSLQVRARVRDDLTRLIDGGFVPADTEIIETADGRSDYRYRILVSRIEWARAVEKLALDVDYPNFKSEVMKSLGAKRESPLHQIWSILGRLQPGGPYARRAEKPKKAGKHRAAGTRSYADEPWSLPGFEEVEVEPEGFDPDAFMGERLREAFDPATVTEVRGYVRAGKQVKPYQQKRRKRKGKRSGQ